MISRSLRALGAALFVLCSCGDGETSTSPCDPGEERACSCEDGSEGLESCGEDQSWGACVCGAAGGGGTGPGGGGAGGGAPVTDCVGPDVWFDETSALCWQNPPELAPLLAATAVDYCDGLQLGGHADWRLPDISELRSLIRGCPTTALGGACGVTATCTGIECEDDEDCAGCGFQGGPAADGCYWDAALSGPCSVPAWSSSPEVNDYVWAIAFDGAYMGVAAILIKKHDARQAVWGAPWRSLRRSGC